MEKKSFLKRVKDRLFPKTEIMLYKTNKASFTLCLIALVLNCLMFLHIYGTMSCIPSLVLGIDLVINIIFMLLAFLFAENEKKYDKKCAYMGIALGIFEIVRIFTLPLHYYKKYLNSAIDDIVGLPTSDFIYCVILMVIASVCLITASAICIYKTTKIEYFLKQKKEENK